MHNNNNNINNYNYTMIYSSEWFSIYSILPTKKLHEIALIAALERNQIKSNCQWNLKAENNYMQSQQLLYKEVHYGWLAWTYWKQIPAAGKLDTTSPKLNKIITQMNINDAEYSGKYLFQIIKKYHHINSNSDKLTTDHQICKKITK